MGKAKKGRKDIKDEEVESDIEEQHFNEKETSVKEKGKRKTKNESNETAISEESKKTKKKKGKSHSNDNSDVEDLSKEVEDLEISKKPSKNKKVKEAVKNKPDSDVSDDEMPSSKPTNKKNKQPRGGFALLEVESGPEDLPEPDSDEDVQPKKSSKKQTVQKEDSNENKKEAGGKKSKKKKRRKDSDDEDLEKVFAELEMEYSGIKKESIVTEEKPVEEVKDVKKKEKKKKNEEKEKEVLETVQKDDEEQEGGTVKTAAQKKKEKKEREKAKRQAAKKQDGVKKQDSGDAGDQSKEATPKPEEAKPGHDDETKEDEDVSTEGKKKKKGAKAVIDDSKTGKGPGKKTIAAMQEALKKMKEEEERLRREEEERIKREEEAEIARLEQLRLEQERKEKKKQKEKERKERQRKEGKLLTAKQKADRARAQAMLEALKAQGVELPEVGEKKVRPGTRVRPNKLKQQTSTEKKEEEEQAKAVDQDSKVEVQIVDQTEQKKENEEDDVKDAWDAESSEDETSEKSQETPVGVTSEQEKSKKSDKSESESESDDDDESEEESSSEESEEDDRRTDAEKKYIRAKERIQKRREEAEKKKSLEDLRAAVVCVLGHVDTGKTKILDKLRRTNVQDGEAGGITQQIGATNVPIDAIKEQIKIVKGMGDKTMKLPGLLIIDTPGHESFSNLRSRGSSLCDIAILVVDIMHGLEPQTIESINLLKQKRTPFVVALNKIDRLYDWETMQRKDIRDVVKAQASHTQLEFEKRTKEVILQFAEQSLNAALFYENPDPRSYVSLVPTSAVTGEGMGNLLALIVDACQSHLAKRLMYSEELQATVLEVKAIPGLGTTIDAILVNGVLREGDTMLLAGTDGPIVTQIRSLLMPQPMRELRVKNAYEEYKEIKAAQGVKIAAKELEKAIAGLNLVIARYPDEVEVLKEEVAKELKSALSHIKLQERGVFVQASTLGSLEALLDFLKSSKIPYAGIRIGPVVKKDVMKASIMLEHDSQYATILAFDVKIERDAQDLADNLGVKIFQADIIYHLFDKFTQYREELKQRKRDEFKHVAVFPCKMRVLPQFVFNSRDPIVCGVMIEAGIIREGTPICVPSKEFVELGIVTSIESNHKQVETARKGQEVCIKIEPVPGEAPKMFGRHFDETDMLISKISRQSIDACKDYFRDDLIKTDWQLMVELKKMFQIL